MSVGAGEMVKGREFDELLPKLTTVTLAVPAVAMSLAGMEAVNWVPLTKEVVRFEPFHLTVELSTKLEPFTVSVKPEPPTPAELGLMLVSTGTRVAMVRENGLVVVPGVG